MMTAEKAPGEVALFVTCLVDFYRPSVAFAAIALIERTGARVVVPEGQTCCGQPAYNSGDATAAKALARRVVDGLSDFARVVVPSGSCAGMIVRHIPALLRDDAAYAARAEALAKRTQELTQFLGETGHKGPEDPGAPITVAHHDSCSALRELGVRSEPRRLLAAVQGVTLKEIADSETCCGFGGLFCVKYPDVSTRIADQKIDAVLAAGADTLTSADLGCLLHLAGRIRRRGLAIHVRHIAEVLAGASDTPALGEGGPVR